MLIRVKYIDDRYDMVRPEMLNLLLEAGNILKFQRCEGWIMPEFDKMRHKNLNDYSGSDRRKNACTK